MDYQQKLPGATFRMTGADYANLVAAYVARRFARRSLKVYREIRIGKTIIGKNRCIDIFCVAEDSQRAFAIECKYQDSQGTVDEKIPYALDDLMALPMAGCIAYAGQGFSDGVRHMLAASRHAAYCLPAEGQIETTTGSARRIILLVDRRRPRRQARGSAQRVALVGRCEVLVPATALHQQRSDQ